MDAEKAAEQIDRNTVCLVGIAGTTEYGMVDPIADLAKIAGAHDLFFHVDAAFGGMVIPFLKNPIPFDFALPGVTSIAVDPHKMGMSHDPGRLPAYPGAGHAPGAQHRHSLPLGKTGVHARRYRPGAPVVGALAVLDYLGIEGMTAVVSGCMKNTERLISRYGDLRHHSCCYT